VVKDEVRYELHELHATLCKAIADPTRLLIIEALRNGPRTVGELSGVLGLSQSNVSQHMAVLRQRAVVRGGGTATTCSIRCRTPRCFRPWTCYAR
jgi:ArsR family transcriptional regulator